MAFIPIPGVAQVRIRWQEDNGAQAQNVLYNQCPDPITLDTLNDLGELWHDLLVENIIHAVTPNWAVVGLTIRDMTAEEGLQIQYVTGFPVEGSNINGALPDQVSYTVTLNTPFVGRSRRGRIYGVGLPANGTQGNNRLNAPTQSDLQGSWGTLFSAFLTEGFPLVVASFVEDGVPRTEGSVTNVSSINVRFPLATQRRRLS